MSIVEAYDRGRVNFMGVDLLVAPGAMVPREETELLGFTAIETIKGMELGGPRLIDMCCGSGNLACALAIHLPEALVWASDLTDDCVSLAQANVRGLGLAQRVQVLQGDLFAGLVGLGLEGSIDMVACNPPYISEGRLGSDRAELLENEPREAFAAGPYGLSIHQRVLREALHFLRPGGALAFEIGLGQDRQVGILFERVGAYKDIRMVRSEQDQVRVVVGQKDSN